MTPALPALTASPVTVSLAELIRLGDACPAPERGARPRTAAHKGDYTSRFLGPGMEFAEVRAYLPGDDVRHIDWRVTARRGRAHTKVFHEERERPVLLAVDYRRSMFFATRGRFKAVQASLLGALFAWQALKQGDRLGGAIFSEEQFLELRPRTGRSGVLGLLRSMVGHPAWQRPAHRPTGPAAQSLPETLDRLQRVARPGSLILLLSDFNPWDEEVESRLAGLRRHSELALVHCFDAFEADLPPAGTYRVSDGLRDLTIETGNANARARYQAAFEQRRQQIEHFCRQRGCRLLSLPTEADPLRCLPFLARGSAHVS